MYHLRIVNHHYFSDDSFCKNPLFNRATRQKQLFLKCSLQLQFFFHETTHLAWLGCHLCSRFDYSSWATTFLVKLCLRNGKLPSVLHWGNLAANQSSNMTCIHSLPFTTRILMTKAEEDNYSSTCFYNLAVVSNWLCQSQRGQKSCCKSCHKIDGSST